MEIIDMDVNRIIENPWNVNRMGDAMRKKLKGYIMREGLVQPLVVRPHPKESGHFELVGGEHRWRICKEELGYEKLPCVVVDLDDKRAKILSVNLNSLSGETVPSLLSRLLNDLQGEMPIDDMQALLPWDEKEIQDTLSLMQLPVGFGDELEEAAAIEDREAPSIVTLVFSPDQREVFDQAIERGMAQVGPARDAKAQAAVLMAEGYLGAEASISEANHP